MIKISAPGKIHLLGEHTVVYGKPALLTTVNLRVTVTLQPCHSGKQVSERNQNLDSGVVASLLPRMTKTIEPIVKKYLQLKTIPPYQLTIDSQIPLGAGLGSSAAVSAAYIAALISHLGHKWDLNLINKLTFEAEKVFHGNPSGGDNSTVVFGGLIWYQKGKGVQPLTPLTFSIPPKLAQNFMLINTGKPKETTKQMVEMVAAKSEKFKKIFDNQEKLVRELLSTIQNANENQLIQIIRAGEKNLEAIGVVSPYVASVIRKIENAGGAAKICGAGGKTKATGILVCYHLKPSAIENIAKSHNLDYFKTTLGVQGLKTEN
ncbi:MAG: mevalonate kinase [Candidatus Daviesbacteria bacterium]|nr:mevalonate kinase [Candidatus Daviesbacteria bacterium]